jgi:hypothetical protein
MTRTKVQAPTPDHTKGLLLPSTAAKVVLRSAPATAERLSALVPPPPDVAQPCVADIAIGQSQMSYSKLDSNILDAEMSLDCLEAAFAPVLCSLRGLPTGESSAGPRLVGELAAFSLELTMLTSPSHPHSCYISPSSDVRNKHKQASIAVIRFSSAFLITLPATPSYLNTTDPL